jgi:F420-dependent oxidoreductase-like protein
MTISFTCFAPGTAAALQTLKYADEAGVAQAWLPVPPLAVDPLIVIAHAAAQTSRIRFGVGVLPIHQRHPAVLATEALALADLLPDRFSLGIGVSHAFIVEDMYGVTYDRPMARLREYVDVLRGLVHHGTADVTGEFYSAHGPLWTGTAPRPVPIILAAVQPKMFELAGEIADGAIAAWCPLSYLTSIALPRLRAGAEKAGRPTPRLIASLGVVFHPDRARAEAALRRAMAMYQALPPFQRMWALAGHPLGPNGEIPASLVNELLVYGDEDRITEHIQAARRAGVDDVMVNIIPADDPAIEQAAVLRLLGKLAQTTM